jgi:8-amino-7-oxononanoate synthase
MDVFQRLAADPQGALARAARELDLWPYFRPVERARGVDVIMEGEPRIMFGSSNFLGLAHDERVLAAAHDALDRYGTATNGSPILNGTLGIHSELEEELADWLSAEAAMVFPSGYNANVGCLSAILDAQDTAICDSGAHASVLDGIKFSGAHMRPFRHLRLNRLRSALEVSRREDAGGRLVTVDSVYSMGGDVSDLPPILDACAEFGARLYVDEAHGFGVLGPTGGGLAELQGVTEKVDLRVGTLSKALASTGGFAVGTSEIIETLRINARTFLFTASISPPTAGAALAALRIARSDERHERVGRLMGNVARLRTALGELGYEVPASTVTADGQEILTPIIPVVAGDDARTCCLWRALYGLGVYTHVALYPSVPRGRSIVRLFVTAAHTDDHVEQTIAAFASARDEADRLFREVVGDYAELIP